MNFHSVNDWKARASFLVLGAGSIGKRHIANLRSLGVQHIGVYDPQAERAAEAEARWGVRAFPSLEAALEAAPHAVFVCSPPVYHIPQALAAAQAGAHLFLEKPLAASMDGVDDLIAAAEARHLRTLVGCNFRFHPGLQRLKALLEEGALGEVLFARAEFGQYLPDWHPWEDYRRGYSARRDLGGGIVLDRIHELDYLVWLFGPVAEARGWVVHSRTLEIETEDLAEGWLHFQSGVRASLHTDYLNRHYTCRAEVLGTEGTAWWDFGEHTLRLYRAESGEMLSWSWPRYEVNAMYVAEMAHFLRVLAGKEESLKDLHQARHILATALALRGDKGMP